MNLFEAKQYLNSKGYLLEDVAKITQVELPFGIVIKREDCEEKKWSRIKMNASKLNNLYNNWLPLFDDEDPNTKKIFNDWMAIKNTIYYFKTLGIDTETRETLYKNLEEIEREKRHEVAERNMKEVLENSNLFKDKDVYRIPGFERAWGFSINWFNKSFYVFRGGLDPYYLSKIEGLVDYGEKYNYPVAGEYVATSDAFNRIEEWLNDNKEFVDEKTKSGLASQQAALEDQANYYRDGGRNWSGD